MSNNSISNFQVLPPVKNLRIFETKAFFFIFGFSEPSGSYKILEIARPVLTSDGPLILKQYPQEFTFTQLNARIKQMQNAYKDFQEIYDNVACIYGFIKFLEGYYMILVTEATRVGSLSGNIIYTISKTAIVPITFKSRNSNDEIRYKTLLSTFDMCKYMYFSYTYDLSKSWQQNVLQKRQLSPITLDSTRAESQSMFVWNAYALLPFQSSPSSTTSSANLSSWIVPIVYGYIRQKMFSFSGGNTVKFTLIARRSTNFAGTRYLRRGVDCNGMVANEVESEQIFSRNSSTVGDQGRTSSIVQCRGSIPLYWCHVNILNPKPDVKLENIETTETLNAAKNHFENLFFRYGRKVHVLSLVKQVEKKPLEQILGDAYFDMCRMLNAHYRLAFKYNTIEESDISRVTLLMDRSSVYGRDEVNAQQILGVGEDNDTDGYAYVREERESGGGEGERDENDENASSRSPTTSLNVEDQITFTSYDFLNMAKVSEASVFHDLDVIGDRILTDVGFYVDPPAGIHPTYSKTWHKFGRAQVNSDIEAKYYGTMNSVYVDNSIVDNTLFSTTVDDIPKERRSSPSDVEVDMDGDNVDFDILLEKEAFDKDTLSQNFSESEIGVGTGSPTGLLQYGVMRTNCMDCLDRTNVAQFCYAKLAINRQLKCLGILLSAHVLQDITSNCLEVWAEHGDAMATQYGGSGAMHKVDEHEKRSAVDDTVEKEIVLTGGAKNALVAVQRYYSNVSLDFERQQQIDILVGFYQPKKGETAIWDLKLRPQDIRIVPLRSQVVVNLEEDKRLSRVSNMSLSQIETKSICIGYDLKPTSGYYFDGNEAPFYGIVYFNDVMDLHHQEVVHMRKSIIYKCSPALLKRKNLFSHLFKKEKSSEIIHHASSTSGPEVDIAHHKEAVKVQRLVNRNMQALHVSQGYASMDSVYEEYLKGDIYFASGHVNISTLTAISLNEAPAVKPTSVYQNHRVINNSHRVSSHTTFDRRHEKKGFDSKINDSTAVKEDKTNLQDSSLSDTNNGKTETHSSLKAPSLQNGKIVKKSGSFLWPFKSYESQPTQESQENIDASVASLDRKEMKRLVKGVVEDALLSQREFIARGTEIAEDNRSSLEDMHNRLDKIEGFISHLVDQGDANSDSH